MPKLSKLKGVRERKMLTQRELASQANVSPTTVAQLETGKSEAQFRTIRKLAAALGVAPEDLIDQDSSAEF